MAKGEPSPSKAFIRRQRRKRGLGWLAISMRRKGCDGGLDDIRDRLGIDGRRPSNNGNRAIEMLAKLGGCPPDTLCYPIECPGRILIYLCPTQMQRFAVDGRRARASRRDAPRQNVERERLREVELKDLTSHAKMFWPTGRSGVTDIVDQVIHLQTRQRNSAGHSAHDDTLFGPARPTVDARMSGKVLGDSRHRQLGQSQGSKNLRIGSRTCVADRRQRHPAPPRQQVPTAASFLMRVRRSADVEGDAWHGNPIKRSLQHRRRPERLCGESHDEPIRRA
jgi:hypothetical protein